MSANVFVLGSFVVDAVYRTARLPAWGETLAGSRFSLGPGGKGSNQAVAAARAGAHVNLLTKVAEDPFGAMGRKLWAEEGIDASGMPPSSEATGSAAILLEEVTGENAIIVVPGACATLTVGEVEAAVTAIASATVFVAQLEIPLSSVHRGLALARAAGVTTVLNPAPAQPLSQQMLALVDYLIPNETEAAWLTGMPISSKEEVVAAAHALQDAGARNIIITLGERGSLLCLEGGSTIQIQRFVAGPVVDTTGAGDAFCGAFAAALAEGQPTPQAARFASAAAGLAVTGAGAALAMPRRVAIEALLLRTGH